MAAEIIDFAERREVDPLESYAVFNLEGNPYLRDQVFVRIEGVRLVYGYEGKLVGAEESIVKALLGRDFERCGDAFMKHSTFIEGDSSDGPVQSWHIPLHKMKKIINLDDETLGVIKEADRDESRRARLLEKSLETTAGKRKSILGVLRG